VWRYSPIDHLDLDRYRPVPPSSFEGRASAAAAVRSLIAGDAVLGQMEGVLDAAEGLVVTRNGAVVHADVGALAGRATLGSLGERADEPPALGAVLDSADALTRLNDALLPDVVVLDVPAGTVLAAPVAVVHWIDAEEQNGGTAPACFPRTLVRLGANARASVVELVAGGSDDREGLALPVTELDVADGADLSYLSVQALGSRAWYLARTAGRLGRDTQLRLFTLGLGAGYDRTRTDVVAAGQGGRSELRSAYLGAGSQVHDIRTMQDHAAPHTTSDLLCKGAVSGTSRSVYSGLIRVRHGAVRAEAMQTNHNLVLDERAHADSVPNLDIAENDVRCSHASTVGPVDEDQRYYVESRGVPPARAERLIVQGFFDDIVDRAPIAPALPALRQVVGRRLVEAIRG
jgi:Fe-S cluster assembly protein SufD